MNIAHAPDYVIIVFVIIFSIAGVFYVRENIHDISFRAAVKQATALLLIGLLFVLISTITNNFIDNQWTNNYIVSFLLLKTVSNAWYSQFPRHICVVGYIFIILGLATISISLLKKAK